MSLAADELERHVRPATRAAAWLSLLLLLQGTSYTTVLVDWTTVRGNKQQELSFRGWNAQVSLNLVICGRTLVENIAFKKA